MSETGMNGESPLVDAASELLARRAAAEAEAEMKPRIYPVPFEPLGDRILAKREQLPEEVVTKGGIFVPTVAHEKPMVADVFAVGPGRLLDNGSRVPSLVSVGDRVLIGKYSGTEVKLGEETFLILKEDEIFGRCI